MDPRVYLLRLGLMTHHRMMRPRATMVWPMPTHFSLRFFLLPMLFDRNLLDCSISLSLWEMFKINFSNVACHIYRWLVICLQMYFVGFDEFTLFPALCPLQHTAIKLAGPKTTATAGSELSEPENPLQWLKRP